MKSELNICHEYILYLDPITGRFIFFCLYYNDASVVLYILTLKRQQIDEDSCITLLYKITHSHEPVHPVDLRRIRANGHEAVFKTKHARYITLCKHLVPSQYLLCNFQSRNMTPTSPNIWCHNSLLAGPNEIPSHGPLLFFRRK